MKILSFNLLCSGSGDRKWQKRVQRVIKTIQNADPDSFGVQEAHIGWMRALTKALPEYSHVGVGRDDGKEKGEFSAVFYKKDKLEPGESGNFWLSETPGKPGKGWDAACVRICSYVALREKATGKEFMHFNTHLDHIGPAAMLNGARLVAEKAIALSGERAIILTGDFNVTPGSEPCAAIRAAGFSDCRDIAQVTDRGCTWHNFESGGDGLSVIDYIFVRGSVRVNDFKVIRDEIDGDRPSDHYPVSADIEI